MPPLFGFGRKKDEDPFHAPVPEAPRRKVTKLQRSLLQLICEASKSQHPHEFCAALRAEGDTLVELLIVPTVSGPVHALPQMHMLPIDRSFVGTVHSHPSGVPLPSGADRQFFRHYGHTHIIIGSPYDARSWRAWDHDARPIELEVVGGGG